MRWIPAEAQLIAELFQPVEVHLPLDQREQDARCFRGSEGSVDELEVLFIFHGIGFQGLQTGQCPRTQHRNRRSAGS